MLSTARAYAGACNRLWNIITAYGAEPSDNADLWQTQAQACIKVRHLHNLYALILPGRIPPAPATPATTSSYWIEEERT